MKVVVTCGPSYEPIDEVRRITNFSSGELGIHLSNHLVSQGIDVICFRGVGATCPDKVIGARVIPFATNDHLRNELEVLEGRERVTAVFHAAALADYRVKSVHTTDGAEIASVKIPSRAGELILTLAPALKLIRDLRDLFPASRIVGWKFELAGSKADVIAAAIRQMTESRTDACVMNGTAYGAGFGFLQPGVKPVHLADKVTLSEHLASWVVQKRQLARN